MPYTDGKELVNLGETYTLVCTREAVRKLQWAVAITLTELTEDLKEAERVQNSGAINRSKDLISEYERISHALKTILKD